MSNNSMDTVWKVFTVVLGTIVVPLFGWVWNTNVSLAQINDNLVDAEDNIVSLEQKIEEAEGNSRSIISIEKDIEYMKATLTRIEKLVTD